MASENFLVKVQLAIDKAKSRIELEKTLKDIQEKAQLEVGTEIKVNKSDVRKAYNEIEKEIKKVNKEQQEGTRENIKIRAQELAHVRMLNKEQKEANKADLEAHRQKRRLIEENSKMQVAASKAKLAQAKALKAEEQSSKISKVEKINLSIDNKSYEAQIAKLTNGFRALSGNIEEAKTHTQALNDAYKKIVNATDDNERLLAEKAYQSELSKTKNLLTIAQSEAKEYVDALQVKKLRNDIEDWLKKNTAATKEAKDALKVYLETLDDIGHVSQISFNQAKQGLDDWDTKMRQAGKLGKSLSQTFKDAVKSFLEWTSASGIVMEVFNSIRRGINELKELDDILTEISKTSDLTTNQLKELGDTAFDSASKYGKKAGDYLTGVQEMYRAGFDNAEQMAELSLLAQSAGDMGSELSNDYIMATNAAYKYKGSIEELNEVLDSQNYITNNAAISMKDIADATTETASVAAQYGVQIDELSALIATATANTRESGSEVGTALKAILINLQDTTSKPVTETFNALGISMTKVVDGAEQLKTPIELIHELANAYNSLPEGDIMRANILNEIGQKRHANTLASILSDMESYNKMLELYNSNLADNSAYNEAMKSANNLSGSLNRLSNTWSDTIENIVNSETLKNGVNFLNSLLSIVNTLTDKLGALGTIGVGAGAILGAKGLGLTELCYN